MRDWREKVKTARKTAELVRCPWAKTECSIAYHDKQWGVPVHDAHLLFEFLVRTAERLRRAD